MEEQSQLPAPGPHMPPVVPKKRKDKSLRWDRIALSVAVLVVAASAWQSWTTREELRRTQIELARRITDSESAATDTRNGARKVEESLASLQNKVDALNASVEEAQGQYSALESMYSEFSRAKDERTLAEVEQAVDIANQQLQLAANVPAAIAALQSADDRLAMLDQARFLPLRKLVARDIGRLRELPLADVTALALQLDTMMGRIDALPLGFERTLPSTPTAPVKPVAKADGRGRKAAANQSGVAQAEAAASEPGENSPGFLVKLASDLWHEFSQLIRIERLDQPDPALMAPANAAYLRENIRLRLLSARLALLQRDGRLFGEDIRQARMWLERYFDVQSKPVAEMLSDLKLIEQSRLTMNLPSLEETSNALHNIKLGGKR